MSGIVVSFSRKSVRNINLRVARGTGEVKVSAPHSAPRELVEAFVASRREWIAEAQQRVLARQPLSPIELKSGAAVPFLGRYIELNLGNQKRGYRFDPAQGKLTIGLGQQPPSEEDLQPLVAKQLDNFYREELQNLLPTMLETWQPLVGVEAKECRVRKMKTRWGSCHTRDARIWMSLELVKYPLGCIDYVLVHELTHLLEPSHNKRFHGLVGEAMPDWCDWKARLAKGPVLTL